MPELPIRLDKPPSVPPEIGPNAMQSLAGQRPEPGSPGDVQMMALALESVSMVENLLAKTSELLPPFAPIAQQAGQLIKDGMRQILSGQLNNPKQGMLSAGPPGGAMPLV